jgi:hypothetical protein
MVLSFVKKASFLALFSLFSVFNLFCQSYHTTVFKFYGGQEYINFNIYGQITLKNFYGPPNYGETPDIDRIESYYVLKLLEPITIVSGSEKIKVEEIQLLFIGGSGNKIDRGSYTVEGKLYLAQTGHHHTPVILIVDKIEMNR